MKMRFFSGLMAIFSLAALSVGAQTNSGTSTAIPHLGARHRHAVDGRRQAVSDAGGRAAQLQFLHFRLPETDLAADGSHACQHRPERRPLGVDRTPRGQIRFLTGGQQIGTRQTYNLRLIFLWFGSWKNGVSSYVPAWVKTNQARFPRVQNKDGKGSEILSTLSSANRDADARAFCPPDAAHQAGGHPAPGRHDAGGNEVGLGGNSRDMCEAANKAFRRSRAKRAAGLHRQPQDTLHPLLRKAWKAAGSKTSGTWKRSSASPIHG